MKRLHILSANFSIDFLEKTGDIKKAEKISDIMLDFIKYCWEHKEDENLYQLNWKKSNGKKKNV